MTRKILVWDAPTRLFHWMQVASFLGAYLTSESERNRDVHVTCGYILLGLIVFRLLWGFIGTRYARFGSFFFTPGDIISYLKSLFGGHPKHYLGHNPAGSVSVWLLLSLGLFVCVTGVMALQDDASDLVIGMHGMGTNVMVVVILLHIAGVVVSSGLHRENLVRAMVTGFKPSETSSGIPRSYPWLAALMVAAAAIFWLMFLGSATG